MCAPGVHGGRAAPLGSARMSDTTPSATISACCTIRSASCSRSIVFVVVIGHHPALTGTQRTDCLDTNDTENDHDTSLVTTNRLTSRHHRGGPERARFPGL